MSATLTGLVAGNYTITELNADVASYTCETTYSTNVVNGEVTLAQDGDGAMAETVAVTNSYTKNFTETDINTPATLTIEKTDEVTGAPRKA